MSRQTKSLMKNFEPRKTEKEAPTKDQCLDKSLSFNPRPAEPIEGLADDPLLKRESSSILRFSKEKGGRTVSARDLGGTRSDDPQDKESRVKRVHAMIGSKFELAHQEVHADKGQSSVKDMNRASEFTTATVSGRVLNGNQDRDMNSETENIHLKCSLEDSQSSSNIKSKRDYFENSDPWIFPDKEKGLCVTTGGKRAMDLMDSCHSEAKCYQEKMKEVSKDSSLHPHFTLSYILGQCRSLQYLLFFFW